MINIESLQKPAVFQNLDYETILQDLIKAHQARFPAWEPLQSDEHLMILEDFAYRELFLKAEINSLASAFFLATTSGTNLDNYALFYGIDREKDENDKELLERILLSFADKSTAGSEESYKSYAFKADNNIEDIAVVNGGPGVVNIYFYHNPNKQDDTAKTDQEIQTSIEDTLNDKKIRPLTDKVVVQKATQIPFFIDATLEILPDQEASIVLKNAKENLISNLALIQKIGNKITLSEINDFLRVKGVKEVLVNKPSENIIIDKNQIGINSGCTITYFIS